MTSMKRQTSATVVHWAISCSAVLSLRMICSAVWRIHFTVKSPAQSGRMRTLIHPGATAEGHVSLFIDQAKPQFDEERAKRLSVRLRRGTSHGTEMNGICFLQLMPWHQRGEDNQAVIRVQRPTKWHIELFDRQQSVMPLPVQRKRSTVAAIVNCSLRTQFI